jgi:HK97 gp10 family phage protein
MMARSNAITITGQAALNRKLKRLPHLVDAGCREAVTEEVDVTADDLRRTAPRDTGELAESVREHIGKGGLSGEAAVTARHAGFVNDGTRDTPGQPFATAAGVRAQARFPDRVTAKLNEQLRKAGT